MAQTSREVVENTLRGGYMERIPVVDFPWKDTLEGWVKEGYPTHTVLQKDPDNPKAGLVKVEEPIPAVDHFGFDLTGIKGNKLDMMPLRGYSEIVEENDQWYIKRNGAGAALKYWKHKSGTPEHIDFRMTSREIWERDYRPHLLNLDPARFDAELTRENLDKRREQALWTHYGQLFVWENMRQSMGDVCMYESLALDPGWIHDYNRVYTDFYKAHYERLFQEAGLPDGIWMYEDLGYKNGLFCSPKMLEELIFPYYANVIDFFHSYGLAVILHSCGNFTDAMPLIIEAGFDAINPMEAKAGCDVFQLAEDYGKKLAFIGGFDARIYESGDKELIRKEITHFISEMKRRNARFIFASDHSISTLVSYDSFRHGLDVYREQMMY
jgi:uroporphyrinogen decarboxylase